MTLGNSYHDLMTVLREIRGIGQPDEGRTRDFGDEDYDAGSHLGWAASQTVSAASAMAASVRDVAELNHLEETYIASVSEHTLTFALIARALVMAAVSVGMDAPLAAAHYARTADDLFTNVAFSNADRMAGLSKPDADGMSDQELTRTLLTLQSLRLQYEIMFGITGVSVEVALMAVGSQMLDRDNDLLSEDAQTVMERARYLADATWT